MCRNSDFQWANLHRSFYTHGPQGEQLNRVLVSQHLLPFHTILLYMSSDLPCFAPTHKDRFISLELCLRTGRGFFFIIYTCTYSSWINHLVQMHVNTTVILVCAPPTASWDHLWLQSPSFFFFLGTSVYHVSKTTDTPPSSPMTEILDKVL